MKLLLTHRKKTLMFSSPLCVNLKTNEIRDSSVWRLKQDISKGLRSSGKQIVGKYSTLYTVSGIPLHKTVKTSRKAKFISASASQHHKLLCLGISGEHVWAPWRRASPGIKQIQWYLCDNRRKSGVSGDCWEQGRKCTGKVWKFLKFLLPWLTSVCLETNEGDIFLGALLCIM